MCDYLRKGGPIMSDNMVYLIDMVLFSSSFILKIKLTSLKFIPINKKGFEFKRENKEKDTCILTKNFMLHFYKKLMTLKKTFLTKSLYIVFLSLYSESF